MRKKRRTKQKGVTGFKMSDTETSQTPQEQQSWLHVKTVLIFCFGVIVIISTFLFWKQFRATATQYGMIEDFSTNTYEGRPSANTFPADWDTGTETLHMRTSWGNMTGDALADNISNSPSAHTGSAVRKVTSDGNPIIAFLEDITGTPLVKVTRWTPSACLGGCWTFMDGTTTGVETISNSSGANDIVMELTDDDYPIIAISVPGGDPIRVTHWTGSDWAPMGSATGGFGNIPDGDYGTEASPKLALDSSGTPHVGWSSYNCSGFPLITCIGQNLVSRWNGSAWNNIPDTGGDPYSLVASSSSNFQPPNISALYLDTSDTVFVFHRAYVTGSYKYYVHRWNVSTFTDTTFPVNHAVSIERMDGDIPYVLFTDDFSTTKITKYSTGSWRDMSDSVGVETVVTGFPHDVQILTGNPYVLYTTPSPSTLHFTHWNGSAWKSIDESSASDQIASGAFESGGKLTINPGGYPAIVYNESDFTNYFSFFYYTEWTGTDWRGVDGITDRDIIDFRYGTDSPPLGWSTSGGVVFGADDLPIFIYGNNNDKEIYVKRGETGYFGLQHAYSTTIDEISLPILDITITPTQTLNGQTVTYYATAVGETGVCGTGDWEEVTPAVSHPFNAIGSDLRWCAILESNDPAQTASISSLNISYNDNFTDIFVNNEVSCDDTPSHDSSVTPFCTIAAALDEIPSNLAGVNYRVNVYTGVYEEAPRISNKNSNETQVIILRAYPGQSPVLDGGGTISGGIEISDADYVTVEGFEVTGFTDFGIRYYLASNGVIRNNSINNITFNGTAIGIWLSTGVSGEGAIDMLIQGNTIHTTDSVGITVQNNNDGITIKNNLIYGVQYGLHNLIDEGNGSILLENNTIHGATISAVQAPGNDLLSNMNIRNNIFTNNGVGLQFAGGTGNPYVEWNMFHGNTTHIQSVTNSQLNTAASIANYVSSATNVIANPIYTDPDSGDFSLASFSPAVNAGDPYATYSNEPGTNGNRINLGHHGNTIYATESDNEAPYIQYLSLQDEGGGTVSITFGLADPNNCESCGEIPGTQTNYPAGVQYSTNYGSSWQFVSSDITDNTNLSAPDSGTEHTIYWNNVCSALGSGNHDLEVRLRPIDGKLMAPDWAGGSGTIQISCASSVIILITDSDFNELTSFVAGETIYFGVLHSAAAGAGTLDILVTSTIAGDSETVTLTEQDPGIFTGSVATDGGSAVSENGTLEVGSLDTVTATLLVGSGDDFESYEDSSDLASVGGWVNFFGSPTPILSTPNENNVPTTGPSSGAGEERFMEINITPSDVNGGLAITATNPMLPMNVEGTTLALDFYISSTSALHPIGTNYGGALPVYVKNFTIILLSGDSGSRYMEIGPGDLSNGWNHLEIPVADMTANFLGAGDLDASALAQFGFFVVTSDGEEASPTVDVAFDNIAFLVSYTDTTTTEQGAIDNEVGVGAGVESIISFAIRDVTDSWNENTCELGTITSTSVASCAYRLTASTNASNGFVIMIQKLTPFASASHQLPDISPSDTVTAGTEGYGIRITAASTGGVGGDGLIKMGNFVTNDAPIPSSAESLIRSDGPFAYIEGNTATSTVIEHVVGVTSQTPAGTYQHVIQYTVLGNF